MAKERNLPSKTTLTTSDYIRVVGSDNASYKQALNDVMSAGGAYQTHSAPSNSNCNDFTTIGTYYGTFSSNAPLGAPSSASGYLIVLPHPQSTSYVKQFFSRFNYDEVYIRTCNNGTWSSWVLMPTRAEIDALNTATQTYTPTFSWTDGTAPTVTNAQFSYTKIGKLCWLSGRFQITDKGAVGNNASLLISLPSGIVARGLTPSNIGTFTPNTFLEPPLFIVRVNNSTTISIGWGAGGGYSSPKITAQYYTVFAVVPLD